MSGQTGMPGRHGVQVPWSLYSCTNVCMHGCAAVRPSTRGPFLGGVVCEKCFLN